MRDREDQFAGCVLGLAIGDALGFPCEFRSRNQILGAFPPNGVDDFVSLRDPRWPERPMILSQLHPPGTYSDDTQMSVAVAEALLEGPGESLDRIMTRMGQRFVAWARSDENNRAPGGTCMTGCRNLAAGAPWQSAGVAESKGCGSAMRVAPIGLFYADDHTRMLEVARASSLLTHGHPAAIESAAAGALLVALALEGCSAAEMHAEVTRACAGGSADLARRLAQVPELLDAPPELALSQAGLGEAWVAEEAIASALWCVWRAPDDFAAIMRLAINTDGDSDSIACIAGGIAGARLGARAIPERWRMGVERSEFLFALGQRLSRIGPHPSTPTRG